MSIGVVESPSRRPLKRNSTTARGVASVEAVIVLPVFVLLFIGVMYFGRLAVAKADTDTDVRRCAWLYSMGNCQEVPEGCAEPTHAAPRQSNVLQKAFETRSGKLNDRIAGLVISLMDNVINDAFLSPRVAHASRTVTRPPLFGGNVATVAGEYPLACNLTPRTAIGVADNAWKLLRP
jgi:hypothetical protein